MLPPAAPVQEQPPYSSTANVSSRHTHKKSSATTDLATSATNAVSSGATRTSPPLLVNSPSNGDDGVGSPPHTGYVRWCMNIALQSFTGEPWAVMLQPAAEDDLVINGSFQDSPADSTTTPTSLTLLRPASTTASQAANSICQQPLQGKELPSGTLPSSSSSGNSPVHSSVGTRMSSSMPRSGLQLVAIDYSNPESQYPGGPALDTTAFNYDPFSEDNAMLHQCVSAVNNPPVTYDADDLIGRITNVEFIAEEGSPEDASAGMPIHYRLASSLEPMLNATLNPAITAVVDHCISSMVLVYGATQEMKQMGLIGTPEECGLLPHGIRTLMERLLVRKERQLSKAASSNCTSKPTGDRVSAAPDNININASSSAQTSTAEGASPPFGGGDDAVSCSDDNEGVPSRTSTSQSPSFVFPSIGSRHHRFVRMEATFIAFDSTSVVDLLDLANRRAELVLKLASPPTPSEFEKTGNANSATSTFTTTDSFVLNAQAMPVENPNDALSALDVGLDNFTRALEQSLLRSESGSSLLFSLTAFTDTCRCATMHTLCLAEDPAAQTWLASTVQARSQTIPLGEEQSWASLRNTPMPLPLHHHAATLLVPVLCFGNMFTSVLICAYNSVTALSRLNRDLTLAVTGYRMRTIPRVTWASSRRGLKKLPPSWEEEFTNDGRRYFIDTTTQTTTWKDPRSYPHCSSRSGGLTGNNSSGSGTGAGSARSSRSGSSHHRPSRISLGPDDKDFLLRRLQKEMYGGSTGGRGRAGATKQSAACAGRLPTLDTTASGEDSLDIGIIVVDTMCRPRVLIHSRNPQFDSQYREQEEALHAKQRELEEAKAELSRKAKTAGVLEKATGRAQDTGPTIVPATAKPREAVQPTAARSAPTQAVDCAQSSAVPAKVVVGLGDGEEEGTWPLCRRNSFNIEDFILEDNSDEGGEDDEACGTEPILKPTPASNAGVVTAPQSSKAFNAEARFYANVLQGQTVGGVDEVGASGTTSCTETPITVSPVIKSAVAPGSSSNVASAASVEQSSSVGSDVPRGGTTDAAAPPEVQDLESLVDEFTAFYRKTFDLQQRVRELEAELKKPTSTARSSSPLSLPGATEAADVGVHELVHQMLKAVEMSPSAELRAALTPMLTNNASKTPAAAAASVALQAFQEALRIAAQTGRASGGENTVSKQ
ncbi:hypothetical protein, conserved [Leishmania tarentolae]|uniref:WW domain-containing protein n=1 Tax=Leishmania tarentolae TaxID=5689 RepID=A0A640KNW6_LEITA|nr:hypothetical protein, conserved [Leishmania tarentolae]